MNPTLASEKQAFEKNKLISKHAAEVFRRVIRDDSDGCERKANSIEAEVHPAIRAGHPKSRGPVGSKMPESERIPRDRFYWLGIIKRICSTPLTIE